MLHTKNAKIIAIVAGGLVLVGILFYFFARSGDSEASRAGITSNGAPANILSQSATASTNPSTSQKAEELLRILQSMNNINLDHSLLTSEPFLRLLDFTVELPPPIHGRDNPFAPILPGEVWSRRALSATPGTNITAPYTQASTSPISGGTAGTTTATTTTQRP